MERTIESTLLKADAVEQKIIELCQNALQYNFFGVCVNPCQVALANSILAGNQTITVTVIGFPLGATKTEVKLLEAEKAVEDGAREIDLVVNIGALKDRKMDLLHKEISAIVQVGIPVKLIVETGFLTREEIDAVVECAVSGGIAFIKTSTGYGPRGASMEDIEYLRKILPEDVGIKASGGIRELGWARSLLNAGAQRLGISSAERIIIQYRNSLEKE